MNLIVVQFSPPTCGKAHGLFMLSACRSRNCTVVSSPGLTLPVSHTLPVRRTMTARPQVSRHQVSGVRARMWGDVRVPIPRPPGSHPGAPPLS